MAYPDRWSGGGDPDTQDIPLVEETIPLDSSSTLLPSDEGMIHFDLDPQNGEFETAHTGNFSPGHAGKKAEWGCRFVVLWLMRASDDWGF